MPNITMLSPKDAEKMTVEEQGAFIDIRTIGEVLAEQLPGSLFLPFDLVNKERLSELGIGAKTPILVCRSGSRAKQAAEALAQQLENVAVLDGGLVRWKEVGLSVISGTRTLPLDRQILVAAGSMILLFTILGLLVSPYFFVASLFMAGGMVFAGVTGACGMARILVMMPWNRKPLCQEGCEVAKNGIT